MVDIGDNLDSHIGLSCTWGTNNHGHTRLHASSDCFHLCWSEWDCVSGNKVQISQFSLLMEKE